MPHETILCVPLGGEIQFRLYPDATHDFDDWPNRRPKFPQIGVFGQHRVYQSM
jgi:hypothetical protein